MLAFLKSHSVRHKAALLYSASSIFLAGATFFGSFVCARLLLPEQLGAFQTAMLLVSYLGFLPLGVFNGFNQRYPFLLGQGNSESATLLARTGYSVARVSALAAALIALGQVAFFWEVTNDHALILAALAVVPIAACSQINNLQVAILTGRQLFTGIARIQFVLALATLALLLLVWKFGVLGQCVRIVVIAAIPWVNYLPHTAGCREWYWDRKAILDLIRRGMPILAIGYLYQVFSIADRTLVAWVKGTEAVGHYALAGLAMAAVQSVYMPLAIATYSKANHAFGRSPNRAALVGPAKRLVILVSVVVLPVAAVIYIMLPMAVPWLLPKYVEGIRAGQVACISAVAFCYCGTAFVFNVTGRNLFYGLLTGCALLCFFAIGFKIPPVQLTLERVAWLRAIISVFVCVLTNLAVFFYLRRVPGSE